MEIFIHISFKMKRVIQMGLATRYTTNYGFAINKNHSLFWFPTSDDFESQQLINWIIK